MSARRFGLVVAMLGVMWAALAQGGAPTAVPPDRTLWLRGMTPECCVGNATLTLDFPVLSTVEQLTATRPLHWDDQLKSCAIARVDDMPYASMRQILVRQVRLGPLALSLPTGGWRPFPLTKQGDPLLAQTTGRIEVDARDADTGKPIPGVRLLLGPESPEGPLAASVEGTTGKDGIVTLAARACGVAPGGRWAVRLADVDRWTLRDPNGARLDPEPWPRRLRLDVAPRDVARTVHIYVNERPASPQTSLLAASAGRGVELADGKSVSFGIGRDVHVTLAPDAGDRYVVASIGLDRADTVAGATVSWGLAPATPTDALLRVYLHDSCEPFDQEVQVLVPPTCDAERIAVPNLNVLWPTRRADDFTPEPVPAMRYASEQAFTVHADACGRASPAGANVMGQGYRSDVLLPVTLAAKGQPWTIDLLPALAGKSVLVLFDLSAPTRDVYDEVRTSLVGALEGFVAGPTPFARIWFGVADGDSWSRLSFGVGRGGSELAAAVRPALENLWPTSAPAAPREAVANALADAGRQGEGIGRVVYIARDYQVYGVNALRSAGAEELSVPIHFLLVNRDGSCRSAAFDDAKTFSYSCTTPAKTGERLAAILSDRCASWKDP